MNIDENLFNTLAQQLQQQLSTQFRKNISFFLKKDPTIAEKFRDFTPEKIKLRLLKEGYLNLVNTTLNDKAVYNGDPQQFCQTYVDKFVKHPNFYRVFSKKTNVIDEENDAHISTTNKCVEILDGIDFRASTNKLETTTNFLLLNGIGMGYILPQVLEYSDVKNLTVVEPHADIFHASLHILDWEQVYNHFESPLHSIKLIIGENTKTSINELRKHLNRIGLYNAVNAFVINHLSSKEMSDITDNFFEHLGMHFSTTGYFDDEQVSLAHTIENWRSNIAPLREHSSITGKYQEHPVFIIGNGPSLDSAAEFLKANHEKAIIISCGTTIGSLRKMGIKPDIHIEMERTRPVVEWLTSSTDQEYRRDITLLALNTVHPDVFSLFNNCGMGLKANDLGTHFFSQYIPEDQYAINLAFCNPTVGNAGLAFAAALGFKEVYLFGLDLGFSAGEQHHSKMSTHYRVKKQHVKSLDLYEREDTGNKEAPANFGGTVTTTPVYISARISFEACLRKHSHIKCYNTSNGLLIDQTTPIHPEGISLGCPISDKAYLTRQIFSEHFHTEGLIELASQEKINEQFAPAISTLNTLKELFSSNATDWEEAQHRLASQHSIMLALGFNKSTEYIYSLLRGSISAFNIKLNTALYLGNSREESLALYNNIRFQYLEFIEKSTLKIQQNLFKLDEQSRNLDSKIKS